MSSLTLGQQRALALLPKVTGSLSVLFSLLIATTILRDDNRRKLCYHRLLFGISCADMSASLWMMASTWPIPSDSGVVYAVGNTASCTAQGFFLQFGVTSPFYNASLSLYYYLVIVRGWKETDLHAIEWLFHFCPLAWGACSALTGLVLGVYENANLWCWVGADYKVFRWAAYYGPLWCMIAIATTACILIYLHVRQYSVAAHLKQAAITMAPRSATARRSSARSSICAQPQQQQQQRRRSSYNNSSNNNNVSGELECVVEEESHGDKASNLSNLDSVDPYNDYDEEDEDDYDDGCDDLESEQCNCENCRTARATAQVSAAFSTELSVGVRSERRMVVPETFCQNLQHSRYVYRQSRRLREIAHQCFWYAAAFYINFAALTATRVIQLVDEDKVYYPLVLLAAICVPVQGLPNFFIYLRPKFKKVLRQAFSKYCCCCYGKFGRNNTSATADTRPWWYRLAQSLSERNHHHRDDVSPEFFTAGVTRLGSPSWNNKSSTAVVHANPAIVNTQKVVNPPATKESGDPASAEGGETVLVVVDTPQGRKWRIESNNSRPFSNQTHHSNDMIRVPRHEPRQCEPQQDRTAAQTGHDPNDSLPSQGLIDQVELNADDVLHARTTAEKNSHTLVEAENEMYSDCSNDSSSDESETEP